MNLRLKYFGVLLTLLLACGALTASAQAAEEFHSEVEKTVFTGESTPNESGWQALTFKSGTEPLICKKATFEGLGETKTTGTVTVHPVYTECVFGGRKMEINTHKCHYNLAAATDVNGHAHVDVVTCPSTTTGEEGAIEMSVPELGATIKVANQTAITQGVHYTNQGEGSSRDIEVHVTATGISYTCAPALICNLGGIGTSGSSATYTGSVTVKGYGYLGGTTGSYEEGNQVGVWKE